MRPEHRCERCLLPAGVCGVQLDERGWCGVCRETPPSDQLAASIDEIKRQIDAVIAARRGASPYECVVAFSGGKDSSFTLKVLVEDYQLRCIAVTVDNGFMASGALENCRAVCGGLGVDHVLFTPQRGFMDGMYRASALNESMHAPAAIQRASSICSACINLINSHVLQRALELGAPLVAGGYLGGQLPRDACTMTVRPDTKLRSAMVERYARAFGAQARRYFAVVPRAGEEGRDIAVINPMLGLCVSERQIVDALAPLGWRRPADAGLTSTNCRLNDLGVYLHHRRHGFHPYALEIAEQLRYGLLTREEAAEKLDAIPPRERVAELAQRIGLSRDDF